MNPQTLHQLPAIGFVRIWQILGCKRRGIAPVVPESRAQWWKGVKEGTRPKPIKLGEKTTVWRAEDIRTFIQEGKWPVEVAK